MGPDRRQRKGGAGRGCGTASWRRALTLLDQTAATWHTTSSSRTPAPISRRPLPSCTDSKRPAFAAGWRRATLALALSGPAPSWTVSMAPASWSWSFRRAQTDPPTYSMRWTLRSAKARSSYQSGSKTSCPMARWNSICAPATGLMRSRRTLNRTPGNSPPRSRCCWPVRSCPSRRRRHQDRCHSICHHAGRQRRRQFGRQLRVIGVVIAGWRLRSWWAPLRLPSGRLASVRSVTLRS